MPDPTPKPCPFCGGEADIDTNATTTMHYLLCMAAYCGATGPERHTRGGAIGAWNLRPAVPTDDGEAG